MRYTSYFVGQHKCPFYKTENELAITCVDSELNDSIEIVTRFKTEAKKYEHISNNCIKACPNCSINKIFEKQWNDSEGNDA